MHSINLKTSNGILLSFIHILYRMSPKDWNSVLFLVYKRLGGNANSIMAQNNVWKKIILMITPSNYYFRKISSKSSQES